MFCVNLCEILNVSLIDTKLDTLICKVIATQNVEEDSVQRIYVGSSFCSQYFMKVNFWNSLFDYCYHRNIKITLTLPVFSEKNLKNAKQVINKILTTNLGTIDEVTVNDYGMLQYFSTARHKVTLNLGRLFFKDPRDIRVQDYFRSKLSPALLSYDDQEFNDYKVSGIELDPTHYSIDLSKCKLNNVILGLHNPLCYMSTGNICKYASINKSFSLKYRPNIECQSECMHIFEHYSEKYSGMKVDIIKLGRTVYYYNNNPQVIGKKVNRIIYFPLKELLSIKKEDNINENISAFK